MLTVLLAALAAHLLVAPRRQGRLDALLAPGRGPVAAAAPRRVPVPVLACAVGGLGVALLAGGGVGVVLGVAVAVIGPKLLGRLEDPASRAERDRLARELPLALDLLSACLAGGAPLPAAVRAVADALPGPCGDRLRRVEAGLAVGSAPGDAWAALAEGEDPARPVAAPAVRALVRAGEGGAPVAAAVARLAAEARAEDRARAEQAARRAGVLAVAPLGACFLPAFVLLGVVPVVVGLAGPLLAAL